MQIAFFNEAPLDQPELLSRSDFLFVFSHLSRVIGWQSHESVIIVYFATLATLLVVCDGGSM